MTSKRKGATVRSVVAILCTFVLLPGDTLANPLSRSQAPASASQTQTPKIPPEQLDSLVAPIALYPDPLLAQTLAASTYPLEIIQLQQWLEKNKNLKDKVLADAVAKESWDPSVQALAALPDVVKRLADDIRWTTDLGNAFLARAVRFTRRTTAATGANPQCQPDHRRDCVPRGPSNESHAAAHC